MITRATICLVVALAVTCQAEPIRRRFDETAVDEKMEVIQNEVDTLKAMIAKRMKGKSINLQDAQDVRGIDSDEKTDEETDREDSATTQQPPTTRPPLPTPTTTPPAATTVPPRTTTPPGDPAQKPPVFKNVGNKRYFLKYKVNGLVEKDLIMLDDAGGTETDVVKKGQDTEMIRYDYNKGVMLVILPSKKVCKLQPIPAEMMRTGPKKLKVSLAKLVKVSRAGALEIEDQEEVEFVPSKTKNVTAADLGERGEKLCKGFQKQWMEPVDDKDKDEDVARQQRWDPDVSLEDRSVYTADVEEDMTREERGDPDVSLEDRSVYTADADEDMTRDERWDPDVSLEDRSVYTADADEDMTREERWDDNQSLEDRSVYTSNIESEPYNDNGAGAFEDEENLAERNLDASYPEDVNLDSFDDTEPSLENRDLSIEHFLDGDNMEERSEQDTPVDQPQTNDWKSVEDDLEETEVEGRDFSDFSLEDSQMEDRDFSIEEREQTPGEFDKEELNKDMSFDDRDLDDEYFRDDLEQRDNTEGDVDELEAQNPDDDDSFFNERFLKEDPEFQDRTVMSDNPNEYQSDDLDEKFEAREFDDDNEIMYGKPPDEEFQERELDDENVDEDFLRRTLDDEEGPEDGNNEENDNVDGQEPNERDLEDYAVDEGEFGDFDGEGHAVMKRSTNSTRRRKYYKKVCSTSKKWTCQRKRFCAPRYIQYCCEDSWTRGCLKRCYHRIPSLCVTRFTCRYVYPKRCWWKAYYKTYKRPTKVTNQNKWGKPKKPQPSKKKPAKPNTKTKVNKLVKKPIKAKEPLPAKKPAKGNPSQKKENDA